MRLCTRSTHSRTQLTCGFNNPAASCIILGFVLSLHWPKAQTLLSVLWCLCSSAFHSGDTDAIEKGGTAKFPPSGGGRWTVVIRKWQLNSMKLFVWPRRSATKTCSWTTRTWTIFRSSCWRMKGYSFWRDCTWRGTRSRRWYSCAGHMQLVHDSRQIFRSCISSRVSCDVFWLCMLSLPHQPDSLAQKLPNLIELWVFSDAVFCFLDN